MATPRDNGNAWQPQWGAIDVGIAVKRSSRHAYRLRPDARSDDFPEPQGISDSLLSATIRLPDHVPGPIPDKVVRPALAVLFRVAVGPSADRYVPRFLAFERAGRGRVGWHWPSLLLPGVWAFYRRLWGPGALFALLLGGGALIGVSAVLFPQFRTAYADVRVRAQLAEALAAVAVLQSDIESTWTSARLLPHQTHHRGVRAQAGAALIDDLDVDPRSGQVRIALGPDVPELAGRVIVLVPSRDRDDRIRWTCLPIDIAPRHLPKECRG